MYHSLLGKPSLRVGLVMGPLIGLCSLLLLAACGGEESAKGGAGQEHKKSTSGTKYVEYAGGKKELYYLGRDPYELNNRYPAATPSAGLVSRLHVLKTCAGVGCRTVENGP